jgi:hypothetical protein
VLVVGGEFGEQLECVYLGGVLVEAVEDGADDVGEFEGVRLKYEWFVGGQVDELLEGLDVALALLVKEALN